MKKLLFATLLTLFVPAISEHWEAPYPNQDWIQPGPGIFPLSLEDPTGEKWFKIVTVEEQIRKMQDAILTLEVVLKQLKREYQLEFPNKALYLDFDLEAFLMLELPELEGPTSEELDYEQTTTHRKYYDPTQTRSTETASCFICGETFLLDPGT